MARVLVVGGSVLQVPLIKAAQRKGHRVLVADRSETAVGVALADQFVQVSTVDIEGIADAARRFEVDCVVTGATDQPLRAVAAAIAARGLSGISRLTALVATRKDLMREVLHASGVPCPRFVVVKMPGELDRAWSELSHPVIVKPVDSSGSRGVTLVKACDQMSAALERALRYSTVKKAIVEELMTGRELSVETMSAGGRLTVLQITEKLTSGPPYFVEVGHMQPAAVSDSERRAIELLTSQAASALGIESGPTHTEVMLTVDGPKVVEVGARLGGDFITSDLVPLSTGIDMIDITLELALGNEVSVPPPADRGAAIRYFVPPSGTIHAIEGIEACRATSGVIRLEIDCRVGDRVGRLTNSGERAGYVITAAESGRQAAEAAQRALTRVRFVVDADPGSLNWE